MPPQEIRFCHTHDGIRIAYSLVGAGPPIVYANRWSFSIEYCENHGATGLIQRLGQERTVVLFERRGIGASQPDIGEVSLETGVADLQAVVEATGFATVDLIGDHDGSHVAAEFAVRNPGGVRRLILLGLALDLAVVYDPSAMDGLVELAQTSWNLARLSMAAWGVRGGPGEYMPWLAEKLDRSVPVEVACKYMLLLPGLNIAATLPHISVPTLVAAWRDDQQVALVESRTAGALIPRARVAVLDGPGPMWMGHEEMVAPILAFLREGDESDRPAGLTEREMEILALLAAGRSNQEIARDLSISARTAERHIGNIYPKIGARNRAEATAYAVRMGISPSGRT
jgi:DNA-binding CsgD family transcriptional regulator/pimeloyl-ACP methyl ester carboxylesterase